ncbi:RHS repeat protein, partial [Lysobacter pythonis]
RQTTNGTETTRTDYDPATALPIRQYAYGKLQQSLTYHPDGTVATIADGRGNTTALSNWKRGIPQHIRYADGATQSALVNDHGWITAVSDENGFATGYGYDAMGRLAAITHPSDDTVDWHPETRTFAPSAQAAYGLPAGHWRSVEAVGNKRVMTSYDGLWRPVVVETWDTANAAATRSVVIKRYDHENRLIYQSYPLNSISLWSDDPPGIRTTYDPLGRVTQVAKDSEHGPLLTRHEYLNGLEVRTTNPRGFQSVNGYVAYDQPRYDLLAWRAQPEGKTLEILRDVFGKPLSITQRNPDSTQRVTRRYVYDDHQQLCKTIEPETGATVMAYDAAGNLAWSAAGLDLPSPTACDRTDASIAARKSSRDYDARNRITGLWFPDGRGNQSWQYTPDGLIARSVVDNDGPGRATVSNEYVYNKRRLLTGESQAQSDWYTWSLGYGYNAYGHLSTQRYPDGLVVNYQPNALGQPTQVVDTRGQAYARGVSYHPNGAIRQFTYGNGLVHTMTQNTRQLPQHIRSGGGVLDDTYSYDANANTESIVDNLVGEGNDSARSRWMRYDGLDRLTATRSGAFGGDNWYRFTYDALDNLRSNTLPGVKDYARYGYDAHNRLVSIGNGANATVVNLGYDVQGNLSSKNGQGYDFDFGNRLKVVSGVESYRYDAQGRRVQSWAPGKGNVLNMYNRSGELMYQQDERREQALAYVYLAGKQIARIRKDGQSPSPPAPPVFGPPVLKASRVVTTPPRIGIALDWNTVPGAVRYELVTDIPQSDNPLTLYEGSDNGYLLERLLLGGNFKVRACRASGECSAWSNTVSL